MRTAESISKDIAQAEIEMRALSDKVNDRTRRVNIAQATRKLEGLSKRKAALKRELAELARPRQGKASRALATRDSLLKAAAEMRALQIGSTGAGAINQVRELFKEIAENDDILSLASYYYGPNASTNIPVLAPMTEPEGYSEGTDSVAPDTAASVYITEIQPYAYAAVLPVSAEMIQMGAVDIEAELPTIFSKAFAQTMHRGMLSGAGTSADKLMRGIYTSAKEATGNRIEGGTSGKLTVTDLAELALTVASKDASFRIIMNPSVYQGVLSSTSNDSEDIKIYKEGLIRDKSIEGVPIILDPYAPKEIEEESKIIAVAAPLSRYAIGVAGELRIEPIRTPRDTQTYFQAIMFFSGKQISDTDVYSVVSG